MSRNYDRKVFDKENSFDSSFLHERTPKQPFTSNGELRRKFDQNLALIERDQPNTMEDQEDNFRHIKRQNARRRGFDMKVNNIDTINDKISGLLSMVKKDRQREKNEEHFHEAPERPFKENSRNPSSGLIDRIKKMNVTNKMDSYSPRPERSVTPFGDISAKEHRRGYSHIEDTKDQDSEPTDKMKKLKLKYLQEEMAKEKSFNFDGAMKQRNNNINGWGNKEQGYDFDDIKPTKFREDPLSQKKMEFDKMLEERRRNRKVQRENEEDRPESKTYHHQHKSAIKPSFSHQYMGDTHENQHKRESPIIKVREEYFAKTRDDPFEDIKTSSPRKYTQGQREMQAFSKVSFADEEGPQHKKIHSTAKIIDEQLLRIKAKINQSESNQKKIESFKPRNNCDNFKAKEHVLRISDCISAQVQFDSHLKPARQAFELISDSEKWNQLEHKLTKRGLKLNKNVLKELITIGSDQHNPFGSDKLPNDIDELVELITSAEKNWQHCALHCASLRSLKNESFEVSDLDLNNKGYLSLEDLVCFVNLYANTFFRNRDLALIMRRLQLFEGGKSGGISYDTFLEAFST